MKEKLTEVWEKCETKQLAQIFSKYMESIGAKKYDGRRKDNSNTYMADGKSTAWNRVECYYFKGVAGFGNEELDITLRKRSGNYLIIGKKRKRAFEVDWDGICNYDEKLLNEIMTEHKALFDTLFKVIGDVA